MNKKRIYLSPPHMGGNERKFVADTFISNWIAPLGPNVDGLEMDLCDFTGAKHAAALVSGTSALHLAMILCNVKPGDVVLCQSFTFSASANPIIYQGAYPVFIDSEKESWNMCPEQLERAIIASLKGELVVKGEGPLKASKPKAIVPVHLYGMPAKLDKIMALSEKYDIPVIEDAAESLGALYKGKQTGTFGKMGILSFNGNKIITTSGGGALLSDEKDLIEKARFLATQARDNAPHYQHSHIGYNYRMSNILAGVGRGQMEVLQYRVNRKREISKWYSNIFNELNSKGYSIMQQPERENVFSNRWLTSILVDPELNKGINREMIRTAFEEENIETRPLWKPMHLQPVFEKYPWFGDGTSETLFDNGLCLPSGTSMDKTDQDRIQQVLLSVFQNA